MLQISVRSVFVENLGPIARSVAALAGAVPLDPFSVLKGATY